MFKFKKETKCKCKCQCEKVPCICLHCGGWFDYNYVIDLHAKDYERFFKGKFAGLRPEDLEGRYMCFKCIEYYPYLLKKENEDTSNT